MIVGARSKAQNDEEEGFAGEGLFGRMTKKRVFDGKSRNDEGNNIKKKVF